MKKVNLIVLGSTNGTDLPAIVKAIKARKINAQIVAVISNKADAGIIEKAKKFKLPYFVLELKGMQREEYDEHLIKLIEEKKPDLILLIGWMRILSKKFVQLYATKTMNIHPSLLPAFAGGMDRNVHKEVLDYGCKITGCTLHFITEEADRGPIIMQEAVKINENETIDSLKKKVQKAEQKIIVEAIKLYSKGKIKIIGNKVKIG